MANAYSFRNAVYIVLREPVLRASHGRIYYPERRRRGEALRPFM